ncbi:MAG: DEAD/DEAH box helicase [Paludibacteraceae bacterium]|nr:DEAD/DEAH box helicase [Paludibacteraceae bacterium]
MAVSVKKETEAYKILKEYDGDNPYMLLLQKNVYVDKDVDAMTEFNVNFILKSGYYEPRPIDKIIHVADWWAEKKQKDWDIDFLPNRIKILTYLGDTDTTYVCYVQYRRSVSSVLCFIPKKAVLTNFLVKDYRKVKVDFERYDRLSGYKRVLYPHQKTAIKFLLARKKCILADDMGLGKTTSVSVAAIEGNFDSILIVCPASLKSNWKRELSFYIPEKDISVIDGFNNKTKGELEEFLGYAPGRSGKKKAELLEEAKTAGKWKFNRFVILNYDIVDEFYEIPKGWSQAAWEKTLEKSPMLQYITNRKTLIIIDEAHRLSNPKSNRYKVLKSLIKKGQPDSIYLVTGTPLTNDPTNIYSVLSFLGDPITDDYKYYMERYCGAFEMVHPKDKEKKERIVRAYLKKVGARMWKELSGKEKDELKKEIAKKCRMLIVPKPENADNLEELKYRISHIYLRRIKADLDLPEKRIHELYYDLTDEQREQYDRLWDEYEEEQAEENPTKEVNKELLEGGLYRRYLSNEMVPYTEKLADKLIAEGEKVVIACCYDEEIYTLKDYYGDTAVLFNGKMDSKQKDAAVEAFMGDDNVKVFLGNIQSAGVGITLTVSSKLIFSDMSYVPADNEQMQDRVHRIGQEKPVDIYYQIFRHTQYEKMWKIVLRKQMTIDAVIKKEEDK